MTLISRIKPLCGDICCASSCYCESILIKQVIAYLSVCLSVRLWAAKPQGLTG